MDRENLNTSHVNQIYKVFQKQCGKWVLNEILLGVCHREMKE